MKDMERYELCLRLSQAEKDMLDKNSAKCGISKSVYLRRLIVGTPIRARPSGLVGKFGSFGWRCIVLAIT